MMFLDLHFRDCGTSFFAILHGILSLCAAVIYLLYQFTGSSNIPNLNILLKATYNFWSIVLFFDKSFSNLCTGEIQVCYF